RKESLREKPSIANGGRPIPPVFRNIVQVRVVGENCSSCFFSPRRNSGKAVGTVANQGQVVRNRLRSDTKLLNHALLISYSARPAIQLNNSSSGDALAQIFVGRANDHTVHSLILSSFKRGRR